MAQSLTDSPGESIAQGINVTCIAISGEVRGRACHARHDQRFSKITFF